MSSSATSTSAAPPARVAHELDAPPWLRVETTLMATARAIRQVYDRRFEAQGLNLSQACLLAFLHEAGSLTQTQIASRLGTGRAAAGAMVDGLEGRGLVERQADPLDRRAWRVALTPAGVDEVAPIRAVDEQVRAELRAGISRAERQQLAQLLLRLQGNLTHALSRTEEPPAG